MDFNIPRPAYDMGQSPGSPIFRHKDKDLPIYITVEFDFFRCVAFNDGFYGKTVSELHSGNLRDNKTGNRHSVLFRNERTSYWSENMSVARSEVRKHEHYSSYLMFWAYDDTSSSFPTMSDRSALHIVNGMELGFSIILYKSENSIELSELELEIMDRIRSESPDGLVYSSHVDPNHRNYLFFESGFRKLSLKQVLLTIRKDGRVNRNRVTCATSSDYTPSIEAYGHCFEPIAKLKFDERYLESEEYISRKTNYEHNVGLYLKEMKPLMEPGIEDIPDEKVRNDVKNAVSRW